MEDRYIPDKEVEVKKMEVVEVKKEDMKSVAGNQIVFEEYEELRDLLGNYKDVELIKDKGDVSSRWESMVFKWKEGEVYVFLDANSVYLNAYYDVRGSKEDWEKFLETHQQVKSYIEELKKKAPVEFDNSLEWYYRPGEFDVEEVLDEFY